jgi:hypothetical protein
LRVLRWFERYLEYDADVVSISIEVRIYKAANYGRLEFLKLFRERFGGDVFKNQVDGMDESATFWNAAVKGHIDVVRWFLSIGYRPEHVYDQVEAIGDLSPEVRQVVLLAWLVHLVDPDDAQVSVEVLFTPLTYLIVASLKRAENEDYYDWRTRFNPFLLRLD